MKTYIAFSGGLDSTVLLHSLLTSGEFCASKIIAIHVNHSLNKNADNWAAHCVKFCENLGVKCVVEKIMTPPPNKNIEDWARKARYEVFAKYLKKGDSLLMAHHLNDQAETVLLRLLRGAGPNGLSGMREEMKFANGKIVRPLLNVPRGELIAYACEFKLTWVEDDGNSDNKFSRNYLRNEIIPRLEKKWPAANQMLARAAQNCFEQTKVLDSMVARLFKKIKVMPYEKKSLYRKCQNCCPRLVLDIKKLLKLDEGWRNLILQYAMCSLGLQPLSRAHLAVINNIFVASHHAVSSFGRSDITISRFRDKLYFLNKFDKIDKDFYCEWSGNKPLVIPGWSNKLTKSQLAKAGLSVDRVDWNCVSVRFRKEGDICRPIGQTFSKPLKKIFTEFNIPPWMRDRIPLIFDGKDLIWVVSA